jgi:hypothetical protein
MNKSIELTKKLKLAQMNDAVISTDEKPIVGTQALVYCVGLLLYNEKEKKAIVAHITTNITVGLEKAFKLMVENNMHTSPIKYLIIDGKYTNNFKTRKAIEEVLNDMPDLFTPFSKNEISSKSIQQNKEFDALEFAFDSRNGKFVTEKVLFGYDYIEANKKKHQK